MYQIRLCKNSTSLEYWTVIHLHPVEFVFSRIIWKSLTWNDSPNVLNLFKRVAVDADKCASGKNPDSLGVRSTLALEFRKLQNSQGVLRAPSNVASAFAIANSVSAEPMRKIPMTWGNLILISCATGRRNGSNIGSDRRCSRWISNKTSARARKLYASYTAEGHRWDRTPPRKRSFHFRYISIGPT